MNDTSNGLNARRLAVRLLGDVLHRRLPLDESLATLLNEPVHDGMSAADRGLVRAIVTATLRHLGSLRALLAERLRLGIPERSGPFEYLLLIGLTQLLHLDVPDHAAVDTTISLIREDARATRFTGLANATLRRVATDRPAIMASVDPTQNAPAWLFERWSRAYGAETARAIAAAQMHEPTLDLSVKGDAEGWAEKLDGLVVGLGTVRLRGHGAVSSLPGFAEGAWWVQDAAASLPVALLNPVPGESVLDLCAAPGGKTAQILNRGATAVAIDRSGPRMQRLVENLTRLGFDAECRVADAASLDHAPVDAVLLDAPSSATGTIRRHPDVAWTKTGEDILKLAGLQRRLLDKAASLTRPGGRLVYATCSLEPEEGERQIETFLERHPGFRRAPALAEEVGAFAEAVTPAGDLRVLPFHLAHPQPRLAGADGFYVCRMIRVDEGG
jgi:16S rRNA (cytosine967-C5)-methyltransferase